MAHVLIKNASNPCAESIRSYLYHQSKQAYATAHVQTGAQWQTYTKRLTPHLIEYAANA